MELSGTEPSQMKIMLIYFFNSGALNEKTAQNITSQLKQINDLKRKPDFMAAVEAGNDVTKRSYREMHFGYPVVKSSTTNDPQGKIIEITKQRTCNMYSPLSSSYLTCLNIYPEIICATDIFEYTSGRNRIRTSKISIIQCYRNHDISVATFTGWLNNLVKMNKKLGIQEIILFGDMNSSSLRVNFLTEITHAGYHKHREKSKPRLIDKIFVTPTLLDIGIEVQVMNSIETIATESNGLGHKAFLIALNETITNNSEPKTIISNKKFKKTIEAHFTDKHTETLLRNIGKAPLQPIQHESNSNFKSISTEEYTALYRDPAALLTDELVKVLELSKITIKKKELFDFDDLKNAAMGNTTDAVKRFSRMTKYVLSSICSESPLLTHSIDGEEKPELKDLCTCLSRKLNKCHRGDEDFMDDFVNSVELKTLNTPTKLTMDELQKGLKNIKPKKTPWIRGITPSHVLEAAKASNNFRKLLLLLLNRCLREGKLATCMNHDSAIFLYKKGSRSDSSNYRPISIDHPFTKVLCEILNQKAIRHINKYRHPLNFSYESGKSTMTAILTASLITEEIVNRGNVPVIICTDMSGAFETCQASLIQKCLDRALAENEIKVKDTVISYMTEKVIFGKEKDGSIIEIYRKDKKIGAGQGSKMSPNLFLIQASSALHGLNRCKRAFLIKIDGVDMFLLVYADDNFSILEIVPRSLPGTDRQIEIRSIVNEFMNIWEYEVHKSGMLINMTKTEVLANCPPDTETYPPIKQSIKWLGMNLKLNKKGALVGDTDSNLKMAKAKTWSKFQQLCLLTPKVEVKLNTFTMFLEPVLNYCLLDAVTAGVKKYEKVINRYQVLQNNFLRTIANVGTYSKISEIHEILGINQVKAKVENSAKNEWEKVKLVQNFKPEYRTVRTGTVPIINSTKSLFWQAADTGLKNNLPKPKFNLPKFIKWKSIQEDKLKTIRNKSTAE